MAIEIKIKLDDENEAKLKKCYEKSEEIFGKGFKTLDDFVKETVISFLQSQEMINGFSSAMKDMIGKMDIEDLMKGMFNQAEEASKKETKTDSTKKDSSNSKKS